MIEIDPPKNQLSKDKILIDSTTANAVMVSIYARMERLVNPNLSKFLSVYTDELTNVSLPDYAQSRLVTTSTTNYNAWANLYQVIYQCNDLLENLDGNQTLSVTQTRSLKAEARFIRAFFYFYLVNLYGHVPLILTTDVDEMRIAAQMPLENIYESILQDLKYAKENLSETYTGTGKVRANRWAAAALLSRIYLYQKDYANAALVATEVISNGLYLPLDPLAGVFKTGSKEAILQLWTQNGFIADATSFIPSSATVVPTYLVSESLLNSFEATDQRKTNWTGVNSVTTSGVTKAYNYPRKYRNRTANTTEPEYLMVLRLSEQYLIRAESRAWQNQISGTATAQDDLNVIRKRAGLGNTAATTQTEILLAIEQEYRHEFFMEWASRFINLKRTGRLQQVMQAYKSTWITESENLPIPQGEITYNKNLVQNQGY